MNTLLILHILNSISILSTAIVFGTDVFFAIVGRKAAALSKDVSVADLMARFHQVADMRMPVIGIIAIMTTLLQVLVTGFQSLYGQLTAVSLAALLIHLFIYFTVSKPVNTIMTQGVLSGRLVGDIRQLQQRWDKVINLRAVLLGIAITGLVVINY